ncbi:serine/threonine protein phosphatase [Clostridia bacterium]|nr:serine/threonine protein phosphatase [Clostridia bacterium]
MSDIHGQYAAFMAMLELIDFKPSDRLCVLGDVIDRGPHGVSLLRRIMKTTNISMILGNHEKMMFDAIVTFKGQKETVWLYNGYEPTMKEFEKLPRTARKDVLLYIASLKLQRTVTIGGKKFCLVHSRPKLTPGEIHALRTEDEYCDNSEHRRVWDRFVPGAIKRNGVTIVFGHTPTAYYQDIKPCEIYFGDGCIGIDCGCAVGEKPGRLGCLRLDDLETWYVDL